MKHIATLLSFIILSHFSIGQNVRFQIVDPHQKGIPYVNFYSQKAKIGKVSNQEGWIELPSENLSTNNEFTISCIGFIKKKLKGNEILNGNKRIVLEEDTKELSEVSIQAEKIKFKKKKLGVDVKSGMFQIGFMNINSKEGGSIAQIMNNKTPAYLEKIGMNIGFSYQDSLKFEVIFYSVKDDMPYEVLNQKRLFWGISKDEIDNGKVELILWKENIYMEKPFFVSIKMIETIKGKTYGVMLNANAFGKSKFKKGNFENWQNESLGVSIYSVMKYSKESELK